MLESSGLSSQVRDVHPGSLWIPPCASNESFITDRQEMRPDSGETELRGILRPRQIKIGQEGLLLKAA